VQLGVIFIPPIRPFFGGPKESLKATLQDKFEGEEKIFARKPQAYPRYPVRLD